MGLKDLKKKWHQSTLNDLKRLKLPTPDHEYGFSTALLQNHLSPAEFHSFGEWMDGQTCMLDDKLGVINYTHDVIRGIDFIRHGKATYWD
jgi:hypothetical protein